MISIDRMSIYRSSRDLPRNGLGLWSTPTSSVAAAAQPVTLMARSMANHLSIPIPFSGSLLPGCKIREAAAELPLVLVTRPAREMTAAVEALLCVGSAR